MEARIKKVMNYIHRLGIGLLFFAALSLFLFILNTSQRYSLSVANNKIKMLSYQKDSISKECDNAYYQIDSLNNENFINSIMVGRYETSLDFLKTKHPDAAKDFENFLMTKAE